MLVDMVNEAKAGDRCFKVIVAHLAIPAFTSGVVGTAISTGSYSITTRLTTASSVANDPQVKHHVTIPRPR